MTAKILLVEDSRYLRTASRRLLTQAGFSVVEASDGEEALRQVRESQPDLIILDMLLPKLGGEHVLQALRQDPATARLPVIVLTSLSQKNAGKLKNAGATARTRRRASRRAGSRWCGDRSWQIAMSRPHHRAAAHSTSNTPAAPMPPPMHIVTTTC